MAENNTDSAAELIALAGEITIAWLQNPNVHAGAQDVPAFLKSLHAAIAELGTEVPAEPEVTTYEPKVPVRSSVKPDYLVSLIDGKKYQTLRRHLGANGLTPDEYRARYGLKPDYPMVAANFAAKRREIAARIGLGRKEAAAEASAAQSDVVETPKAVEKASSEGKPAAKPRRSPPKGKVAASVVKADAPVPVTSVVDGGAAASVPAKPKQAGRKVSSATAAPEPVAAAAASDLPVAALTKPKRASSPKQTEKSGASVSKAIGAKPPAKAPHAKKPVAVTVEAEAPES